MSEQTPALEPSDDFQRVTIPPMDDLERETLHYGSLAAGLEDYMIGLSEPVLKEAQRIRKMSPKQRYVQVSKEDFKALRKISLAMLQGQADEVLQKVGGALLGRPDETPGYYTEKCKIRCLEAEKMTRLVMQLGYAPQSLEQYATLNMVEDYAMDMFRELNCDRLVEIAELYRPPAQEQAAEASPAPTK